MSYEQLGFKLSPLQKKNIAFNAMNNQPMTLGLGVKNYNGVDVLFLTKSQINKVRKSEQQGRGMRLNLSKKQLSYNKKQNGGFIWALLPALGTALATGAATSLGSYLFGKVIGKDSSGKGMSLPGSNGKGLFLPGTKGGFVALPPNFPMRRPYPEGAIAELPKQFYTLGGPGFGDNNSRMTLADVLVKGKTGGKCRGPALNCIDVNPVNHPERDLQSTVKKGGCADCTGMGSEKKKIDFGKGLFLHGTKAKKN